MGERYWITGVQLEMIFSNSFSKKAKKKIQKDILEEQCIGNFFTCKEKRTFKKEIRKLTKTNDSNWQNTPKKEARK